MRQVYYFMLIGVDPVSAAIPLTHGGENTSVGADHSRPRQTCICK